jgi:hypothetical protein
VFDFFSGFLREGVESLVEFLQFTILCVEAVFAEVPTLCLVPFVVAEVFEQLV